MVSSRENQLLLIPGPTPVPPEVQRALARPMIAHRGTEFPEVFKKVCRQLQECFKTKNEIIIFAATGTGAMESAVVNTLSPGDHVLCVSIGKFGERWIELCRKFGVEVDTLEYEWGEPARPEDVAQRLAEKGEGYYRAVLFTHNETSTGLTNDSAAIARAAREHGALTIVDCISGILATPCPVDEWELDVVVAGSQKAFMIPPGLAFVSVSERAWEACANSRLPKYYWDWQAMRASAAKGETAYTPAVGLILGLEAALELILAEGVDNVIERHRRLAEGVRAAVSALGLSLLGPESHASNAVTAIRGPEGINPDELRKLASARYGVIFSGGQGKLKGKIFRISHMGAIGERELLSAIAVIEMCLKQLGYAVELGRGVAAAEALWAS